MTSKVVESSGDDYISVSDKRLLTKFERAQLALEQKQAEFAAYLDELKAREKEIKELKSELYERMEASGQKKIETDHFTVTAVWTTKKHSLDTKALQAMHPALYKQVDDLVGKDSRVQGYVRITTKGDN